MVKTIKRHPNKEVFYLPDAVFSVVCHLQTMYCHHYLLWGSPDVFHPCGVLTQSSSITFKGCNAKAISVVFHILLPQYHLLHHHSGPTLLLQIGPHSLQNSGHILNNCIEVLSPKSICNELWHVTLNVERCKLGIHTRGRLTDIPTRFLQHCSEPRHLPRTSHHQPSLMDLHYVQNGSTRLTIDGKCKFKGGQKCQTKSTHHECTKRK